MRRTDASLKIKPRLNAAELIIMEVEKNVDNERSDVDLLTIQL